jgi:hypothetical protein
MPDKFDVPVSLTCMVCHQPVPFDNKAKDEAPIACPGCGTGFGTHGEIRKRALAEAEKQATAAFKKIFKP